MLKQLFSLPATKKLSWKNGIVNTHIFFVFELVVNSFFLSAHLISLPTCLLFTFGLIKGIYAEIWKPFRKSLGFLVVYGNINEVYYKGQGQLSMCDQMVRLENPEEWLCQELLLFNKYFRIFFPLQ